MRLYMVVTNDEYELPLIVSENIHDIEWFSGSSESTIRSCINRVEQGKLKRSKFRKVEVEEWQMSNG